MTMFFSGPGQTFSVSAFIDPIIAEFGWSRSLISSLYAAGTLVAGFTMTLMGRLVDAKGYRTMLLVVVTCLACACLLMSFVFNPMMILVAFIGLRIFGQGSMTLIPNSLVPQWFITKRARAMSLVALGIMVSSALLPYINTLVIEAVGWRNAWRLWAVLLLVIMAPAAYFLVRNRPEDMGLLPDNAAPSTEVDSLEKPVDEVAFTLERALRTSAFWIVLLAGSVPAMVGTGLTFHHMSILVENGLSQAAAAGVFTVTALVAFPCTLIAGVLCDRWSLRIIFSLTLLVGVVTLFLYPIAATPAAAAVLGVMRGIEQGFLTIIAGVIWPQYFGRRYLASIRGVATMAMVLGSALGPPLFGAAYDLFGGYREVSLATAALPLAAAISALFLKEPKDTGPSRALA